MNTQLNGATFATDYQHPSTLFSWTGGGKPTADDIACEKMRLEALHDCKLMIYSVDHPVIQGKQYTRVTWVEECQ